MDFSTMSNDDLAAALTEKRTKAEALFALTEPTIEQVDEAEQVLASIREIETEQSTREQAAKDAAERFAAARASFSAEGGEDGDEGEESEEETEEEADEADAEEDPEDEEVEASAETTEDNTDDEGEESETVTASVDHRKQQTVKVSAARKVARKVKRPEVEAEQKVTITAAAGIPDVAAGASLDSMEAVASALMSATRTIPTFNARAAAAVRQNSGNQPVLRKTPLASFAVQFKDEHVGGKTADKDHNAVKTAVEDHQKAIVASLQAAKSGRPDAVTAAGWCSPSEVVYNWIADFVVDGLISLPEVAANRGGLLMTEGPQLLQGTYAEADSFGWGGTEAEAEAGDFNKVCGTIECPDFVDHRLDFDGYCWTIPLLTEATFPELVADALRVTDVAYAHRMNARYINDIRTALGAAVNVTGFGGTVLDSIEALTQIAVKERRWWNLGVNAVMEVKLPQFALEVFKFDMARRSGLALNDIATEQKVAAHFANHNLAVEYLSDMQDLAGSADPTPEWPDTIEAFIYPAGTFIRAAKDVVNLSTVHDAASLSENQYMGVFFEQGVKVIKRGYRGRRLNIPVCTAGTTGANAFVCEGGSF